MWTYLNSKTINTKITNCKAIWELGRDKKATTQVEGDSRPGLRKLFTVSGWCISEHQSVKLESVGSKDKAPIRRSSYCILKCNLEWFISWASLWGYREESRLLTALGTGTSYKRLIVVGLTQCYRHSKCPSKHPICYPKLSWITGKPVFGRASSQCESCGDAQLHMFLQLPTSRPSTLLFSTWSSPNRLPALLKCTLLTDGKDALCFAESKSPTAQVKRAMIFTLCKLSQIK